jgi:histidinol-phosphate aminotransferase
VSGEPGLRWLCPERAAIPTPPRLETSALLAREHVAITAQLHLNESSFPPSPAAVEAIRARAAGVNRYPETHGGTLAEALARRTGIAPDRIVFGCGSDEILHLACVAALAAGDEAVMPTPSFPRYRVSTLLQGAKPVNVKLRQDGANDVDGLVAAIGPKTRAVFCCNPNNPTGAFFHEADLARLAAGVPEHVLLVVDEAYGEFARPLGAPDTLAHLATRRGPWVVTRTFSKAYALAGLRLGYGLCSDRALADGMGRGRTTFNVSDLALAAGEAALADEGHVQRLLDTCAAGRTQLDRGLRRLGLAPLPSATNFVAVDLKRPVDPVLKAMRDAGVLAREFRDPGYETCLRISVGTEAENAAALAALERSLAPARAAQ